MDQIDRRSNFPRRQVLHCLMLGFSLIELLTVVALVAIVSVFLAPSVSGILRGSNLSLAGNTIADHLSLAWQEAVTTNRDVEVRFYEFTSKGKSTWQALQTWKLDQTPTGPSAIPVSRVSVIPESIVITTDDDLSPLISNAPKQGTVDVPSYGSTPYRSFGFRANGSLDISVGASNYVTLINAVDAGKPLVNYVTIQINPVTGKIDTFRP